MTSLISDFDVIVQFLAIANVISTRKNEGFNLHSDGKNIKMKFNSIWEVGDMGSHVLYLPS